MKKMKLLTVLFLATIAVACGQTKPDNTFEKPMYFPYGIYIGIDTNLHLTWPTGSESVTWDAILNKPSTFPPATHNHSTLYRPITWVPAWNDVTGKPVLFSGSYLDLTNTPGDVQLQEAINRLRGIIPPRYTTAQINAFTLPIEEGLEVYDLTLHVKKMWNGTIWKIFPTTN